MPVSFYTLVSIIVLAFLVTAVPFLALPQALESAAVSVLGVLILGTAVYALYRGYVRVIRLEERRASRRVAAEGVSTERNEVAQSAHSEEQDEKRLTIRKHDKYGPVQDE